MLNELSQLADALEREGISPKVWDPKLKELPKTNKKKPCFQILLAKDGTVDSIEILSADLVASLRKWEPSGNGYSFPGLNINPLYRIVFGDHEQDRENKKKIKNWGEKKENIDVELLKTWCNKENDNWNKSFLKKLSKCLKDIPQELRTLLGEEARKDCSAVYNLFKRISLIHLDNEETSSFHNKNFHDVLEEFLWSSLERGEPVFQLLPLLIHVGKPESDPGKDRGAASVYFDIPDWDEYPVASLETIEIINKYLVTTSNLDMNLKQTNVPDAFGNNLISQKDKLPDVKLPFLGNVKLRAMNSESPCQTRYGFIDALSFPVGQDTRRKIKSALEWLASPSREGETWGIAGAKELLFSYPVQLPTVPIKLATCFGAHKKDDQGTRFALAARDVIRKLNGTARNLKDIELNVFSLKKMDKARTKVVFHRNYTAQRLVEAAEGWEKGCTNLPDVGILTWDDKKRIFAKPQIPFPLQIAPCLNQVWKQDGTTASETPVIIPTQGIELLLDEKPELFVPHLLATLIKNSGNLLVSIGGSLHRNEVINTEKGDRHKIILPAILGLLLYKLGIQKEEYMKNAPFLVGKMMKLADELHTLYCHEMRDNNLPAQLVGNALMTAALESPVQALSQLAFRFKPYYAWAQTTKRSEKSGLAHYFIGQYADVAEKLAELEIPTRLDDKGRAQLFLGYLSSNKKKKADSQ